MICQPETPTMPFSARRMAFAFAAGSALFCGPALAATPFVIDAVQAPATLDPAYVCDITDNGYVSPLYATLLAYPRKAALGPEGVTVTAEDTSRVIGGLAQDYKVSDDGLTITLTLREGLTFASGTPIDAAAVVASLKRALSSGACGTYFMEAAQFGNTKAIEAQDARTVVIRLAKPEPLVIHALTQPNLGIVDVATVDANGGKDWLTNHAAGSGPYTLKSYKPGIGIEFSANSRYYGPAPREPEVRVNFVADTSALLLQIRAGKADVTLGAPRQAFADIEAGGRARIISLPVPRWYLASLPNKVAPFDNVKLRQALSYATPYEALLKSVAFGHGALYFGPFPPTFAAYNAKTGAVRAYDLPKAKAVLAESGVKTPVPLTLVVREGATEQEKIATILQGAWKQIGVEASVSKLSPTAYSDAVGAKEKTAAIIRFDGPSVTDPAWLLNYDLRCTSPYNTSNYCNSKAEALLDKAAPLSDPAARQAIWDEIAPLWVDDAPRIPLFQDDYTAVVSSSVKHWDFAQDGPFEIQLWGR